MSWRRLGVEIRRLRESRGMTQADLARNARVSLIYVKKIEAGEKVGPSFPVLDRIARALHAKLVVTLEA
jgi:transcriptional regulator with XRE-family HTH domain